MILVIVIGFVVRGVQGAKNCGCHSMVVKV